VHGSFTEGAELTPFFKSAYAVPGPVASKMVLETSLAQLFDGTSDHVRHPRSVQAADGRIFVFGHVGGDDAYVKVDQSIVMNSFRLQKK